MKVVGRNADSNSENLSVIELNHLDLWSCSNESFKNSNGSLFEERKVFWGHSGAHLNKVSHETKHTRSALCETQVKTVIIVFSNSLVKFSCYQVL